MICPLCSETVSDRAHLATHLKYEHKHNVLDFQCKNETCCRKFRSYHSFIKHLDRTKCDIVIVPEPDNVELNFETDSAFDTSDQNASDERSSSTEPYSFDGDRFSNVVRSCVDVFVAKLYCQPLLPRNMVQSIVCDVKDLVSQCFLLEAKKYIMSVVSESQVSTKNQNDVTGMLQTIENAFSHVSTEHNRFQYFKTNGFLISPVSFEIGVTEVWKTTPEGTVKDYKKCYVEYIPLDIVLKKFLELPDAFDSIMSYMAFLNTESNKNCKENFVQCPLWKMKRVRFLESDIVLPLYIYCDGFECNNPLGSHSKCLDGVYVSLPCLPKECQSTVDNIFLGLLYEASLRKEFTDAEIFSPILPVLRKLEQEGISVSTSSGVQRVFFVTALFIADNKALNSLGGFVEGFTANYFCRFCSTHKHETHTQFVEDSSSLRDEISYNNDVAANDSEHTGVKTNCIFNELPSFHITSNYSVDCFHDLAEGVCHYVLIHLLKHCIPKYFSLACLNERIASFKLGLCDSNSLRHIAEDFVTRKKLKMTGSETLLFCKVLGLLIGDKVPEKDAYWLMFVKLRQISDICFAKSVLLPQSASILKVLVSEFNKMYVSTTGDTLKPKMHNLVHYCRALTMSGPLSLMSTARYESKHRTLTVPARATTSRVKICSTLAQRHQLAQSFRFLSNMSILPKLQIGPGDEVELIDFDNFYSFRRIVPQSFINSSLFCPSWVEYKGTVFKPGMVLLVNVTDQGPRFGQLKAILVKNEELLFLYEYYLNLGFSEHMQAYAVSSSDVWSCKQPHELYDPLPLSLYSDISGDKYVILRYSL